MQTGRPEAGFMKFQNEIKITWEFRRNLGVPYFGVHIRRILLFRVLY